MRLDLLIEDELRALQSGLENDLALCAEGQDDDISRTAELMLWEVETELVRRFGVSIGELTAPGFPESEGS